ncbi:MAG: shikimate kinase [Candidatus Micrarchaeota archaeon]
MTDIFAVVGKPVLHSRSPQMMNSVFQALGIDAIYTRLAAESAEQALETAKAIGMKALNITTPFKQEMAGLVELDGVAKKLGAVNTVLFYEDGKILGINTDVDGVVGAFSSVDIKNKKAVVLGAGGAAKAAVVGLLSIGAEITVVNRSVEKAEEISNTFGCKYASLTDLKSALEGCTILVSALSTYERVVPPELLKKEMVVFDANYAKETQLLKDAKEAGCKTIDGTEWLAHHGVKVFEIFTGKKVSLEIIKKAIEQQTKKPTNTALIGMMGSGKTANAIELAEITGKGIFDSDHEIERQTEQKITVIFREEGEEKFRVMESEQMRKLDNIKEKIIACGGGVVLHPENIELLRKNALVVWLWATPETIEKRVDGKERPLLNVANRSETIKKILETRKSLYAKAADVIIATDKLTPKQITERILYESNAW